MITTPHIPVMLDEVVEALAPCSGAVYVDATFGAGGYSRALLETADCKVWGIDRDPLAVKNGARMVADFPGRLNVLQGRYGEMSDLLADVGIAQIDGLALDIGLSSMQIDDPSRGFSFRADGPLDMRMGDDGQTAADVVNELAERELADIIYKYGEERASRRIARAIVEFRGRTAITRSVQLANLVRGVVAKSRDGIDPATRTFQALRIYVNDELAELDRGLEAAEALLGPCGRLVVVSFHSLEDRRVKTFLQARSGNMAHPSRHVPVDAIVAGAPTFQLIKRGAVRPRAAETRANPRARSARMRWAVRTRVAV